jgi:hypothetical protein
LPSASVKLLVGEVGAHDLPLLARLVVSDRRHQLAHLSLKAGDPLAG